MSEKLPYLVAAFARILIVTTVLGPLSVPPNLLSAAAASLSLSCGEEGVGELSLTPGGTGGASIACTVAEDKQPDVTTHHWDYSDPSYLQEVTQDKSQIVFALDPTCESSSNSLEVTTVTYRVFSGVESQAVCNCTFFIRLTVPGEVVEREFENYTLQEDYAVAQSSTTRTEHYPRETGDIFVGSCSNSLRLNSTHCYLVNSTWYRNQEPISSSAEDDKDYNITSDGTLNILSLTLESEGLYVCLVVLNLEQGPQRIYRTVDTYISLTDEPSPTAPPNPTDDGATPTINESVKLSSWAVGLIVANLCVVLLLVTIFIAVGACLFLKSTRASRSRPQRRGRDANDLAESGENNLVDLHKHREVSFKRLLFEDLLHKGTFKVVHHAMLWDKHVTVKRLINDKSELGMEELANELVALKLLSDKLEEHSNVMNLVGMTTRKSGPACLVLEYLPHGSLQTFLGHLREGPIPEWYLRFTRDTLRGAYHKHVSGDLMSVLEQVAAGMKFLSENNFIHRDLSTRNIFLADGLRAKIGNFGMYHEGNYYLVTQREHFLQDMAPECLWEKRYTTRSDVWSFGILAYRIGILESEDPFPGILARNLLMEIENGKRPPLMASFSNEMSYLLQRCWQFIPNERPDFNRIHKELCELKKKPTRHILLRSSKDSFTPGHVSESGEVFLLAPPLYALTESQQGNSSKSKRHSSTTQQSLISSIDDTEYTRETAETMVHSDSEVEEDDGEGEEDTTTAGGGPAELEEEATRLWVEKFGQRSQQAATKVDEVLLQASDSESTATGGNDDQSLVRFDTEDEDEEQEGEAKPTATGVEASSTEPYTATSCKELLLAPDDDPSSRNSAYP